MSQRVKETISLFICFVKQSKRWIINMLILSIMFIIGIVVTLYVSSNGSHENDVTIEDTPIEIENIRPKGDLVVCSSIIEDYATTRKTETTLGFVKKEHVCAQMLKQKCCYKIDLDKVVYSRPDSSNIVWVKLPEPEYQAYTQSSDFMSDDEEYWSKAMPSTNNLKKKVAQQIQARFCTPNNKRKAERYAEDVICNVLNNLGLEVEFERTIHRKED